MLVQRLRRWSNIKPTLIQYIVFAGMSHLSEYVALVNYYIHASIKLLSVKLSDELFIFAAKYAEQSTYNKIK